MDLGFPQETKTTKGIYTQEYSGYKVVALESPITHRGGVAVFYLATENFSMEALRIYGTNVVIFHLESGGRRWFITGCYLAPDDALTIEDVFTAIIQRSQGAALLVVGDFNTKLDVPEGRVMDKDIAAAME